MTNSVLEKVASKIQQNQVDAIDRFRQLARQIGDEKEVQPEAVEGILAAADKSLADLESAVLHYQRRKRAGERFDTLDAAQHDLDLINALMEKERSAFSNLKEQHRKKMTGLAEKQREAQSLVTVALDGEKELRDTPYEEMTARLEELQARRKAIKPSPAKAAERLRELRDRLQSTEATLLELNEDLQRDQKPAMDCRDTIKDLAEKISHWERLESDALEEQAELERESEELRKLALIP